MPKVRPKVLSYPGDPPKRMIFIGNSFFYYNNSMHNQVLGIARAADPAGKGYGGTSVTISGSAMDWHNVEGYFANKAMASYSFDENNSIVMTKREKLFDAAIMMDCSQCPDSSGTKDGLCRIRQEAERIGQNVQHRTGVVHVVGLCGQAGDDATTRQMPIRRPAMTTARSSFRRGWRLRGRSSSGRISCCMQPTGVTRARRERILRPPRCMQRFTGERRPATDFAPRLTSQRRTSCRRWPGRPFRTISAREIDPPRPAYPAPSERNDGARVYRYPPQAGAARWTGDMTIRTALPWISLLLIALAVLNPIGLDFIRLALFSNEQLSRNIAGPIVLMVLAILCALALVEFFVRMALLRRAQGRTAIAAKGE